SICLNWDNIVNCSVVSTLFSGSILQHQLGVAGPANVSRISQCQYKFVSGGVMMSGTAISMMVDTTLFEFTNQQVNTTVINFGAASVAVAFIGCQSADAAAAGTGTVVSYSGSSFVSSGCRWGGATTMTALNFPSGAIGQQITGNQFNTFSVGVALGAASGPI